MEKSINIEFDKNKKLTRDIEKIKDNKEIDILNERNKIQAAYEREMKDQDNKYKKQLKMIEGKILTLLESKAKDIKILKDQISAKDRLVRKYEELLEKQRKDFLIKS